MVVSAGVVVEDPVVPAGVVVVVISAALVVGFCPGSAESASS